MVVLSAFDTGLVNICTGEGIYGLHRALVITGSESQVISLWKVADDATKELMVDSCLLQKIVRQSRTK
ncbi:CHAT domain-containing protein [Nostoc sp.]|uniref:CHAT domain-containing protein n=1 Tax=Nostoc sp. TaxID=1180 RepID=UPI002FF99AB1